jgi:hypothetical protein
MSVDPNKFGLTPSLVEAVKEALKGDQHKIDKNNNGKIDGQDFKILRGKTSKFKAKLEFKKTRPAFTKEGAKPDFIDLDKDGNKKEPMKHAAKQAKEEVDQVNEAVETTHENPLVTVHDKNGLHTHANLSTANKIFNTNVKHTDVHKGDVTVTSGHKDKNKLKFAISKHHATRVGKLTKEEVEQVDEISKKTLGSYITKASDKAATHTGAAAHYGSGGTGNNPAKMAVHQAIATKRKAGIQKAVDKLTKEEAEQTDEAMSPKQKAHSNRLKNNPGRKGSVYDPSSNFDAPNHKVDVVVSKDDKKETKQEVVQAKDKHDAMFKVQMKFHKMGYKVHDTKHKGMVKEEAIAEADDAVAKQIAAKKDAMQKQIQQKIAQKQMSAMQAKANKRLSSINASSHDDKEMKKGGKEQIVINPPLKEASDLPKSVVSKGHEIAKSLIKHRAKVREPYAVGMAAAKKSAGIKD